MLTFFSGVLQSTMATSIGDFSRYSKKPASAALQIIFVPLLWTICAMFGAIASNMALAIYGELLVSREGMARR